MKAALQGRFAVSVDLAANVLGIGRNAAYRAVKLGDIPSVKIGGRILVPTAALRNLLGLEGAE
jgi:excisionase family DNA binding protein